MQLVWPHAAFLWEREPGPPIRQLVASPAMDALALVEVDEEEARLRVLEPRGGIRWERPYPPEAVPSSLRWSDDGELLLVESRCAPGGPSDCAFTEAYGTDGELRWSYQGKTRYRPGPVASVVFGHAPGHDIEESGTLVSEKGDVRTFGELGIPDEPVRVAAVSETEFALYGPGNRRGQSRLRLFNPERGRTHWAISFDAEFPARGLFPAEIGASTRFIVWWLPFEERRLARVYGLDRGTGALVWRNFDRLLGMEAGGLLKVEERENRVLLLTDLTANGQYLYVLDLTTGDMVTSVRVAASHQGGWSFNEENLAFFGYAGPRRILLVKGGRNARTVAVVYDEELSNPEVYAFTGLAVVPLRPVGDTQSDGLFFSLSGRIVEAWGTVGGGL